MSNRIKKINELIRELAATSVSLHAPKEYLATVTCAEASKDLKRAIVWISVLGNEAEFWKEFQNIKSAVQHDVTSKMYTKYTPLIEFRPDHSGEYAQKIERLLNEK